MKSITLFVLNIALALASFAPAAAAPPVFHGAVDATASGAYVYVGACGSGAIASGQICTTSSNPPTNTCAIGALALSTVDGSEYNCTALNTWTLHVFGLTAGTNIVVGSGSAPTVSVTAAPVFTGTIVGNAAATTTAQSGYNGVAVIAQATAAPTPQPGNIDVTGNITTGTAPLFGGVPSWVGAITVAQGGTGLTSGTTGCLGYNGSTYGHSNCVDAAGSNLTLTGTTLALNANPNVTSLTAAGTLKSQPASGTNALLQLTGSGTAVSSIDVASNEPNNSITIENDASGIGSLVNIGEIYAKTPNGNCGGQTIAHIDLITAGTAATPGGGITFHTSDDSGSCADAENLVLTADHHVYMPKDQFYQQFNTPATCTQNVPCGTVTWTFASAFHNTAGTLSQPMCTSGMIRDDNSTSRAWILNVQSISATAVTYNYTSLNGISSATTLEIWTECHPASY